MLLSKKDGGLEIRNLRLQNESLLLKWLWRYTSMRIRLCGTKSLCLKYGEASPWCTEMVTDTYGVGVWRTIRNYGNLWKTILASRLAMEQRQNFGEIGGWIELL